MVRAGRIRDRGADLLERSMPKTRVSFRSPRLRRGVGVFPMLRLAFVLLVGLVAGPGFAPRAVAQDDTATAGA